jgi:hypothetical protein
MHDLGSISPTFMSAFTPIRILVNVGEINTWGRFHQTLIFRQKDAGAQRLAKKFAIQFHQLKFR